MRTCAHKHVRGDTDINTHFCVSRRDELPEHERSSSDICGRRRDRVRSDERERNSPADHKVRTAPTPPILGRTASWPRGSYSRLLTCSTRQIRTTAQHVQGGDDSQESRYWQYPTPQSDASSECVRSSRLARGSGAEKKQSVFTRACPREYRWTTTHQDTASLPIEQCRTKARPSQTNLAAWVRNDEQSFVRPPRIGSTTGRLRDRDAMFIASPRDLHWLARGSSSF